MASVRKRPSTIPVFASPEEEAAFWDRHSTADFEDDWESVAVSVTPNISSRYVVQFELDADAFHCLRDVGRKCGWSLSDFAQSWAKQALADADLDSGLPRPKALG